MTSTGTSEVRVDVIAIAILGLSLAAMATFLVGGLGVQIQRDLGFGATALGGAITGSFLVGGVIAPVSGPFVDRIGAKASIRLGAAFSVVALVGIGALAETWAVLTIFMVVGGAAFAFVDPGLALMITQTVPEGRRGLVFGLKESSIPAASLLAGVAVPSVAAGVGWRWAFALGVIPALGLTILLRRLEPLTTTEAAIPAAEPSRAVIPSRRRLVVIGVATAFGSAAASGVGVLFTSSAVGMGLGESIAGALLAVGGLTGMAARIGAGHWADRRGGVQLRLISLMMLTGGIAMSIGSMGGLVPLTIGVVGTFAGGWGWTGLLFYSLVRISPANPAAATSIGVSGLIVGNGLGSLIFGLVAESYSYPVAWQGAAVLALGGAGTMLIAHRMFDE